MVSLSSYNERTQAREFFNSEPLYKEKDLEANARFFRSIYQQCPVCKVRNSVITNVHCVKEHGLTKKEVEAEYGKIMTGREIYKQMQEDEKQQAEVKQ